MTADIPRSLGDPVMRAACGLAAPKGLMQARSRSARRIAAGSREEPFPSPAMRTGGSNLYWVPEVVAWHQNHTPENNPSRPS